MRRARRRRGRRRLSGLRMRCVDRNYVYVVDVVYVVDFVDLFIIYFDFLCIFCFFVHMLIKIYLIG